MKILISGSEGSLMQSIIPKLLAQGHKIVGVDNLYKYKKKSKLADKEYELIVQDLADRGGTIDLCKGVDAVFISAAKIYGVGGFNHYCADIIADDSAIQGNLLQSCAKHNVKHVVYISSSMVYESCIQDINYPVTEDLVEHCTMPKTEYGLTKLLGERMCEAFRKQYNINYVIWRPFNIITPYETSSVTQGFSHVFADFIDNILIKKLNPVPIIGSGEQIRCFTNINDVAEIISKYSFDNRALNQSFNICNVEPVTMKELAKKIYQYTNSQIPINFNTTKDYKNDVMIRLPSIDKLTKTFGPQEFQSLDQSIAECVKDINAQK